MAQFLLDNFTGSDGALLSTHTGDSGVTWTQHATFGAGDPTIRGNRLSGNDSSAYYASATSSAPDYSIFGTVFLSPSATDTNLSVYGRGSTAADTGYKISFQLAFGDTVITLVKVIAGTPTTLGTHTIPSMPSGTSVDFELRLTDAAKKVFINGVEKISSANNDITAAGVVFVKFSGTTVGGGYRLDSVNATELVDALAVTLPIYTLSSAMAIGVTGAVSASIPRFGAILGENNLFTSVPMLTSTLVGATGERGTIVASMPEFTLSSEGTPGLGIQTTLPLISLVGEGVTGATAIIAAPLPLLGLVAAQITGVAASIDAQLPSLLGQLYGAGRLSAAVPLFSMEGAGALGAAGELTVTVPSLVASITGVTSYTGNVTASLPFLQLESTAVIGATGEIDRLLPKLFTSLSGTTGTTGEVAAEVPLLSLTGSGHSDMAGVLAAVLPTLFSTISAVGAVAAVYRTLVINTRNKAVTEYDNFEFNSITEFRGRILAAGPNGIFILDAANTDDGTAINAEIMTGESDLGTTFNKRIDRVYAGYKSDSDLEFHTITSQDGRRKYMLARNGITGIQQRRVIVGHGPKARYWQFGIVNRDGSDFLIESILIKRDKNRRRII